MVCGREVAELRGRCPQGAERSARAAALKVEMRLEVSGRLEAWAERSRTSVPFAACLCNRQLAPKHVA